VSGRHGTERNTRQRRQSSWVFSWVMTSKRASLAIPKAVDIATSAASRPRPMTMRPIRGWLCPRVDAVPTASEKDFGPAAEIHGLGSTGTPMSPR
jgi:hypothetical protein